MWLEWRDARKDGKCVFVLLGNIGSRLPKVNDDSEKQIQKI